MKRQLRVFLILISLFLGFLTFLQASENGKALNTSDIDILLLMDNDYGANCDMIITKFEQFKWNVTIAGPSETILGCDFTGNAPFDTDLLVTEVNIELYDCLCIMPGETYAYLYENSLVNAMITNALSDNLIVAAWCRAVRILADADVISGKNVTGHADYQAEYEAAGATFNLLSPPIIDGNIVTSVRSNFYQTEMCLAIATALGVYETDAPTVAGITYELYDDTNCDFQVNFSDVSGILSATIRMKVITDDPSPLIKSTLLTDSDHDGTYEGTIQFLEEVDYEVIIEVKDIFWNEATYNNVAIINNKTGGLETISIIAPFIVIAVLLYIKRKK